MNALGRFNVLVLVTDDANDISGDVRLSALFDPHVSAIFQRFDPALDNRIDCDVPVVIRSNPVVLTKHGIHHRVGLLVELRLVLAISTGNSQRLFHGPIMPAFNGQ